MTTGNKLLGYVSLVISLLLALFSALLRTPVFGYQGANNNEIELVTNFRIYVATLRGTMSDIPYSFTLLPVLAAMAFLISIILLKRTGKSKIEGNSFDELESE